MNSEYVRPTEENRNDEERKFKLPIMLLASPKNKDAREIVTALSERYIPFGQALVTDFREPQLHVGRARELKIIGKAAIMARLDEIEELAKG